MVVAAGAIHRGRSLAAALMWGAQGVWVGKNDTGAASVTSY
jgi:NAD(P)H-dependent flavin oxidoreductase YrpB (nitropropane dioxygenase family)